MMIELNGTSMRKHNHNSALKKTSETSDVRSYVNEHAEWNHPSEMCGSEEIQSNTPQRTRKEPRRRDKIVLNANAA